MKSGFAQISIPHQNLSLLLIGSAAILGVIIALGKWILLVPFFAIPLVLRWPVQMSLGIFALVLPFDSIAATGEQGSGTTLNSIVGAASALILLGTGIVHARLERPPRAALWWSLFIAWSALSVLWALDLGRGLHRIPTAFALLLLYLTALSFRMTRKEVSWVVLMTILGGMIGAGYASWQFRHGGGVDMRASVAIGESETDPNQFAAGLLLPMSLAMGGFISSRDWIRKMAMLTAFGVIGFGVLLSMSRGSLVAAGVMVLVYLYRLRIDWRILLTVSILALLLFAAIPDLFFVRLQNAVTSHGQGRFDVWRVGLVGLKDHGMFGAGLDNFPDAYSKYAGYAPIFRGYHRDAHNVYLQILMETGIVGFLLFASALVSQFRMVRRIANSAGGLVSPVTVACEAACWGMLAASLSLNLLWRKAFWLSWILLAIAARPEPADDQDPVPS